MRNARPVSALLPVACLLLAALAPARGAAAPAEEDAAVVEARAHLNKAKLHYKLGEFDEAIKEFKEAYRIRPVPALLYNLGQACRMAGQFKQAKFYYETYVRDMPEAPNRSEVEKQIEQVTALLEQDAARSGRPPEPPAARPAADKPPERVAEKAPARTPPPAPAPAGKPGKAAPKARATEPARVTAAEPAPLPPPETAFPPPAAKPSPAAVPVAALRPAPAATKSEGGKVGVLPVALGAGAAALAVGGVVSYLLARGAWSEAQGGEHPRAQVDSLVASGDSKYAVSLGLGGAALAAGVGAAVTFIF